MTGIRELIAAQPLFADLADDDVALIAGCGQRVQVQTGQAILRHDAPAEHFYLLITGRAQLEIEQPGRGSLVAETLLPGAVVGISWLFPPHRYFFDAIAIEPCDLIAIDVGCLRAKCDDDSVLGHLLMTRFAGLLIDRIHHLQLQLLDVYSRSHNAADQP